MVADCQVADKQMNQLHKVLVEVLQEVFYEYKVEAVGYYEQRATEGWKPPIETFYCGLPGDFTLSNPTVSCKSSYRLPGPYPWAEDFSWTDSEHAVSYDLNRYLYDNGSIIETTTLSNATSPSTDKGFGNALDFDGSDQIDLAYGDHLDNFNELSIEFWYPKLYLQLIPIRIFLSRIFINE